MSTIGIETLKKAALLLIQVGQNIEVAGKDGFNMQDIFLFIPSLAQVPEIIKNRQALADEFKAMTADDRAEFVAYVETNFILVNKNTQEAVDAVFETLISVLNLIEVVKGTPAVVVAPIPATLNQANNGS